MLIAVLACKLGAKYHSWSSAMHVWFDAATSNKAVHQVGKHALLVSCTMGTWHAQHPTAWGKTLSVLKVVIIT